MKLSRPHLPPHPTHGQGQDVPVLLTALRQRALTRPEGYLSDVISRGKVIGEFLYLPELAYVALRVKYSTPEDIESTPCLGC